MHQLFTKESKYELYRLIGKAPKYINIKSVVTSETIWARETWLMLSQNGFVAVYWVTQVEGNYGLEGKNKY